MILMNFNKMETIKKKSESTIQIAFRSFRKTIINDIFKSVNLLVIFEQSNKETITWGCARWKLKF